MPTKATIAICKAPCSTTRSVIQENGPPPMPGLFQSSGAVLVWNAGGDGNGTCCQNGLWCGSGKPADVASVAADKGWSKWTAYKKNTNQDAQGLKSATGQAKEEKIAKPANVGSKLSDEQLAQVLELFTGRWEIRHFGDPAGESPPKSVEHYAGRWVENGRAVECVGTVKTSSDATEPSAFYHITRTFDKNRNVFVDQVQSGGNASTRHGHWNPDTNTMTYQFVEPLPPPGTKVDGQVSLNFDSSSSRGFYKVIENGKEVFFHSIIGKKKGPVDNKEFEKLLAEFRDYEERVALRAQVTKDAAEVGRAANQLVEVIVVAGNRLADLAGAVVKIAKPANVGKPSPKPPGNTVNESLENLNGDPDIALPWTVADKESPPKSEPGSPTTIVFHNNTDRKVKIFWVNYGGGLQLYRKLNPDRSYKQRTFSSHTWLITDEKDKPLGYFRATRKAGQANIE